MPFKKYLCFAVLCCFVVPLTTKAQTQTLVGIWRGGNDPVALHRLNSWDAFGDKWKELAAQNQRLVDIEVVRSGSVTQYTGAWRKGTDDYALYQVASWESFVQAWQKFAKSNLRLVDLEVFQAGQEVAYVGVWRAGTDAHALHQLNSWEAFIDKWKEMAAKNLHLVDIEAVAVGNQIHYVGAWRAGKEGHLFYAKTYSEFTNKWKELGAQDQRLVEIELVRVGAALHYIGVWHSGSDGYALYQADSWEDFTTKWTELNAKNLRLIDLAIADKPGKQLPPSQPPPNGKPIGLVFDGKPLKTDPVSGLDFPADMPAIHYPQFVGCNSTDRKKVEKAWAYAHFSTWRATQLINYIATRDNKAELWSEGFVPNDNKNWSPRTWFGEFKDSRFRFQLIHEVINKLWNDRFLEKKYSFKVKCREQENDGPHPCYIKDDNGNFKYSANHILLGTINFCPAFLADDETTRSRAQTVVHEILHWLSAQSLYVSDTHTHSDKVGGLCKTKTEKIYGLSDAMHMATSDGCIGNDTLHREIAARNNDNYAYFIQRLGNAIYDGTLKSFR